MKVLKTVLFFLLLCPAVFAQNTEKIAEQAAQKLQEGANREAADLYNLIPERNQKPAWIIGRARALFFLGKYDSARMDLNKIQPNQAEYPAALADRAEVHYWLEMYARSKADCEKLRSLKPEAFTDRTYNIFGLHFYIEKAYDSARFYFRKSLELKPEDKTIYYNLALTFENQNQTDSACEAYRNSARLGLPEAVQRVKDFCGAHFMMPEKPAKYTALTDLAGILKPEDFQRISAKLNKYQMESSVQIAVVIVPTLGEFTVEDLADKIFREWGIGQKETNNGLLFLIAYNDHKMRIQTGYGLEEFVPDLAAAGILEEEAKPAFRSGDYAGGIEQVTDTLIGLTSGQFSPRKYEPFFSTNRMTAYGFVFVLLVILLRQSGRKWFNPQTIAWTDLPNGRTGSLQGIAPTSIGGSALVLEFFGEDIGFSSNLWFTLVPASLLIFVYCYNGIKKDTKIFEFYQKIDSLLAKEYWDNLESVFLGKTVREKRADFLERFKNLFKSEETHKVKELHDEIAECCSQPHLFFQKRADAKLRTAVLNYRKTADVFSKNQQITIELLLTESPVYDKKSEGNISPEEQAGLEKLTAFFAKDLPLLQTEFVAVQNVLLNNDIWGNVRLREAKKGTDEELINRWESEKNSIFPTDPDALEQARKIRLETELLSTDPGKLYKLSSLGNLKVLLNDKDLIKHLKSSVYLKKGRDLFQKESDEILEKYQEKTTEELSADDLKIIQNFEEKAASVISEPGNILGFDAAFLERETNKYRKGASAWSNYTDKYTATSVQSAQTIFDSRIYIADIQKDPYEKNKQLAKIYTDLIVRSFSQYLVEKPKVQPVSSYSSSSSSSYTSYSSSSNSSWDSGSSSSDSSSDWGGGDSGGGGASSDW